MDINVFEQLYSEDIISKEALDAIKDKEADKLISVHWDLRTLLYFSVLLFSAGLGIILYKNIDTIGHAILVSLTGLIAAACLFYCFRVCAPYSREYVASPNVWFDYVLLFGCLSLITFVGYLQYQYHVFGMEWGLAVFTPMLVLFYCAYYFDHKGALSLAITNLGAWMGIAVAPLQLFRLHGWGADGMVINGILLGVLLHLLSLFSLRGNIKAHFSIVYKNFGVHVLYISLIAALFVYPDWYAAWFIVMMGVVAYHFMSSLRERSLYFLVVTVLYGYVGASYVLIRLAGTVIQGIAIAYIIAVYFICSGIGLVKLLMYYNKQLKGNDSI